MSQPPNSVKVDTDQARALVVTYQPHHPSAIREHSMTRIQVYLGAGEMAFTSQAGKVEKIAFKAGDVRWSPAGARHISENITDHPFGLVEIELKNHPRPFTPSDLDPLKTDPKHYTLEFENDQVRILRVRFAPTKKAPVTTIG
jgi:oxalate decarboxylase/phosphoglucose isomerase-like protein (cupin superfamily)